eukprot:TRINITY_DN2430_c0_g2_i1.p1 TRINITY_DN2430_c0_g2~~TRINITY_DN2430_c0_g2_i1.p1  ORF type:complete len:227 (+),score=81.93 TRINITY_DN2430_c0_g2_i1:391-1071(+)
MDFLVKEHVEGLGKIVAEEFEDSFDSFSLECEMFKEETLKSARTAREERLSGDGFLNEMSEEEKTDNGQEFRVEQENTKGNGKEGNTQMIQLPKCSIVKKTSRNALIGMLKNDESLISERSSEVDSKMKSGIVASELSDSIVGNSKLIHTLKGEEYLIRNKNKATKSSWKNNSKIVHAESNKRSKLFEEFMIIGESHAAIASLTPKGDSFIPSQLLYQFPGLSANW